MGTDRTRNLQQAMRITEALVTKEMNKMKEDVVKLGLDNARAINSRVQYMAIRYDDGGLPTVHFLESLMDDDDVCHGTGDTLQLAIEDAVKRLGYLSSAHLL